MPCAPCDCSPGAPIESLVEYRRASFHTPTCPHYFYNGSSGISTRLSVCPGLKSLYAYPPYKTHCLGNASLVVPCIWTSSSVWRTPQALGRSNHKVHWLRLCGYSCLCPARDAPCSRI